jgi:hypothetical protein
MELVRGDVATLPVRAPSAFDAGAEAVLRGAAEET